MAQEKISFNTGLMALPLLDDASKLWNCNCRDGAQVWDLDNRILPAYGPGVMPGFFFLRKADADAKKFNVTFYNAVTGTEVGKLASGNVFSEVYIDDLKVWNTVVIPTLYNDNLKQLGLTPGVYYLTVAGLTSEPFRVKSDRAQPELSFELENSKQLNAIPYQTGYKQQFGLLGSFCAGVPTTYTEGENSVRFGNKTTFFLLFRPWTLDYQEVGRNMAELFLSLPNHEWVTVSDGINTIRVKGERIDVVIKADSCCTQSVTLTFKETLQEIGVCKKDRALTEQTDLSTSATGYSDPAESDPTATPYTDPVPVVIPTPELSQIAEGTEISRVDEIKDCITPYLYNGIKYKTRRTVTRADGIGGTKVEYTYIDPCTVVNPPTLPIVRVILPHTVRAGQPFSIPILNEAIFSAPAGVDAPTQFRAEGLPAGATYSSGRVSAEDAAPGVYNATVYASVPGGGEVAVPVELTVTPATPTVQDLGILIDTRYNAATKKIDVSVIAPYQPQARLASSADGTFAPMQPTNQPDAWTASLPGAVVGSNYSVNIKQEGVEGNGTTVSGVAVDLTTVIEPEDLDPPTARTDLSADWDDAQKGLIVAAPATRNAAQEITAYKLRRMTWTRAMQYLTTFIDSSSVSQLMRVLGYTLNYFFANFEAAVDLRMRNSNIQLLFPENYPTVEPGVYGFIDNNGEKKKAWFFGKFLDGATGFVGPGSATVKLLGTILTLDTEKVIGTGKGIFNGLATAATQPITKQIAGFVVPEINEDGSYSDYKVATVSQVVEQIKSELSAASGKGKQIIRCYNRVLPPLPWQTLTIPADQVSDGRIWGHEMEGGADDIFVVKSTIQDIEIVFIDNTHIQLNVPQGVIVNMNLNIMLVRQNFKAPRE